MTEFTEVSGRGWAWFPVPWAGVTQFSLLWLWVYSSCAFEAPQHLISYELFSAKAWNIVLTRQAKHLFYFCLPRALFSNQECSLGAGLFFSMVLGAACDKDLVAHLWGTRRSGNWEEGKGSFCSSWGVEVAAYPGVWLGPFPQHWAGQHCSWRAAHFQSTQESIEMKGHFAEVFTVALSLKLLWKGESI